jgi:glucose-6-phosphate isomerase
MQATEERAESRTVIGSPAWKALESHYKKVRKLDLRKLFADDPTQGERLTASAAGIELDYSKNRITDETLALLFLLAKDAGLRGTHRCHVFRQQNQHHRESRGPSHQRNQRQPIHGPPQETAIPDLEDVPRESRKKYGVGGLLGRADDPVPDPVCVSGAGA